VSNLSSDIRTIPNLITLSRILLLGVGGVLYFSGHKPMGIALAVLAGLTDYLDGWVARATGQVTRLGEILDQFCDLCFESFIFVTAVDAGFFPPYVIVVYLLREFWVLCIRRFCAGIGANIPSSLAGKAKSNVLGWGFFPTFVSVAGFWPSAEPYLGWAGKGIVTAGLGLSYISGLGYTRAFLHAYGAHAGVKAPPAPTDR